VGVVLETAGVAATATMLEGWRTGASQACARLGWPAPLAVARPHATGTSLALTAPLDQLFTATDVNEWAWQRACGVSAGLHAPGFPLPGDAVAAEACLVALARAERRPDLTALLDAAAARGVPVHLDDDIVSVGEGEACACWPLATPPHPADVAWEALRAIPKALVTGSNGKTTTVRLLAAMFRAHGWRTGHSCTDGLFVDGARIEAGDYSGPVGARTLLRHADVQAAVLETARGGLLRRGLAVRQADVAVVTNVSADHFGEYGIDTIDDLAATKLVVARALAPGGRLVVNGDDPVLVRRAETLDVARGWFALDDANPVLRAARVRGEPTCAFRDGELRLVRADGDDVALGRIEALPLALGGLATYNLANLAAAALAADAIGVAPATIAGVFARFGAASNDNPGRLQRWSLGGATVLLDYAHNPDGLEGFLRLASALRGDGRLGLLLGQAGNREDADVRALAAVAAGFAPARIVLKDIDGMLRGRAPGAVPAVLREELLRRGIADATLDCQLREADAARALLAWCAPGDVLAMPIHAARAREDVVALLDRLQATGWRPGEALAPVDTPPSSGAMP
jgi:UDP-N-acetylmuramyl tripeptide synthase